MPGASRKLNGEQGDASRQVSGVASACRAHPMELHPHSPVDTYSQGRGRDLPRQSPTDTICQRLQRTGKSTTAAHPAALHFQPSGFYSGKGVSLLLKALYLNTPERPPAPVEPPGPPHPPVEPPPPRQPQPAPPTRPPDAPQPQPPQPEQPVPEPLKRQWPGQIQGLLTV